MKYAVLFFSVSFFYNIYRAFDVHFRPFPFFCVIVPVMAHDGERIFKMSFSRNKNYQLLQFYKKLPADVRGHSIRVSVYMQVLFEQVLLSAPQLCPRDAVVDSAAPLDFVREVGFYHDIGKILVPRDILYKHGKLTPAEHAEIEKHTVYTEILLTPFLRSAQSRDRPFLNAVIEVGKTHHERWDGGGYPYGLKGRDIPFFARLCSVADSYDAMLSRRVYSPAFSDPRAAREIERCAGTQFDPDIVEIFLKCKADMQDIGSPGKVAP